MLITEKRMVRTTISVDLDECYAIEVVTDIAENLFDMLEENKKLEMVNPATGEIIDKQDLKRVYGILHGIRNCREWVLE